jgi:hypothetical protein
MLSCLCRFDGISNLLKAQSGLHGAAGPRGQRPATKGLYMFGGVGCGKTMLMDLLVASAPKEFQVGMIVRLLVNCVVTSCSWLGFPLLVEWACNGMRCCLQCSIEHQSLARGWHSMGGCPVPFSSCAWLTYLG